MRVGDACLCANVGGCDLSTRGPTCFAVVFEHLLRNTDTSAFRLSSFRALSGSAEQVLPEDYIPRSETALAALVAQGITVSVSSGDGGAVGQLPYKKYKVLIPSYPATSAYTTAVGATQLTSYAGSECGALNVLAGTCVGERVSSTSTSALITSGGGYSTVVKPLSYMKDAVATYARRAHNLPPSAAYNAEGRAYPDVAALGHNFLIVYGSDSVPFFLPVDGTSASSPVFAGVVALVAANAHAVDGVTGLGDIKPLLYSDEALTSGVFGDVTMGDNSCGRYDPNITSPCAGPGACRLCRVPGCLAAHMQTLSRPVAVGAGPLTTDHN